MIRPEMTSPARACLLFTMALGVVSGLTSCASNEELQQRLDERNEAYSRYQDRRAIRSDAMDERYRAHYDRVMN
jgi:hypothetical protein